MNRGGSCASNGAVAAAGGTPNAQTNNQQQIQQNVNNEINFYSQQHQQQQQLQQQLQQQQYVVGNNRNPNHYQQLQHNGTGNVTMIGNGSYTKYATTLYQQQQQQQHYQPLKHHGVVYGTSGDDHYELNQYIAGKANDSRDSTVSGVVASGNSGGGGSIRTGGPNLVNKQLVLPFVPPSFLNNSQDGITHLIKPSEYLKSISDKRSYPSSNR